MELDNRGTRCTNLY